MATRADHRKLEETMLTVLQMFARSRMIESVESMQEGGVGPRRTTVKIKGELNLTDFAMAVNLELETPGVISGRAG